MNTNIAEFIIAKMNMKLEEVMKKRKARKQKFFSFVYRIWRDI